VLALAPLLIGATRKIKARLQRRRGPPLLQPYRDIRKLIRKEAVLAENASWLFRSAPYMIFASTWVAAALVPTFATGLMFSWVGDLIAITALLGSARFFLALVGMDVGTSFGGIGSSREMLFASLAEPAMIMIVFTVGDSRPEMGRCRRRLRLRRRHLRGQLRLRRGRRPDAAGRPGDPRLSAAPGGAARRPSRPPRKVCLRPLLAGSGTSAGDEPPPSHVGVDNGAGNAGAAPVRIGGRKHRSEVGPIGTGDEDPRAIADACRRSQPRSVCVGSNEHVLLRACRKEIFASVSCYVLAPSIWKCLSNNRLVRLAGVAARELEHQPLHDLRRSALTFCLHRRTINPASFLHGLVTLDDRVGEV
jgi:hypothetical protein